MSTHAFGYRHCPSCGTAVQRKLLETGMHRCDPERYARHQGRRLHWRRGGFESALAAWLTTPAGRFALFEARRRIGEAPGPAGT